MDSKFTPRPDELPEEMVQKLLAGNGEQVNTIRPLTDDRDAVLAELRAAQEEMEALRAELEKERLANLLQSAFIQGDSRTA